MIKKNIVIIGLGGVGGYFGFKINQANKVNNQHHISFVARAETYENIKNNGLQLISPEHPKSITIPDAMYQNISEISNPDLILVCVKEYDLENVCLQLDKVIEENSVILPMMNGVDIYDRIRKIIPNNVILPSCVYVASHIKEKGIVEHKGKAGKLIFGKDPQNFNEDVNWIERIIDKSCIKYEFKDNALLDIWTKFIFIASFGLVTAKYNSSIGVVCNDETQRTEAIEIMQEILLIATTKDIPLPNNIIDITLKKASAFPFKTPTSLQLDINSKKEYNELELFAGAIIRYGDEENIACPFTQKMYSEIKTIHN